MVSGARRAHPAESPRVDTTWARQFYVRVTKIYSRPWLFR
jgi:hypothetical protein